MLSTGDGKIHEPSLSAFLCYLLDPGADHGLHSAFLELFLEPIIKENKIFEDLMLGKENKKLKNLSVYSKDFLVEVEPEVSVFWERKKRGERKKRDVDIVIEIYKKNEDEDPTLKYVFGIENKIKNYTPKSIKDQLRDEINGIQERYKEEKQKPFIGFIFIAKNNEREIPAKDLKIKRLFWDKMSGENKTDSIYNMLSEVLTKETSGEIEPVYEYTKHTIKALMNFIASDFKTYVKEKDESAKWKKTLWPCERYNEFIERHKTHRMIKLMKEIHKDIFKKYKNITCQIAPKQKRISYKINNERGSGNKFFHIAIKTKETLEAWLPRTVDKKEIEIKTLPGSDDYGWLLNFCSYKDYEKCKDVIKKCYDHKLQ